MEFRGYLRPDGRVGIRNHLLILPTVVCAARTAELIAGQVQGAVAVPHQHGCAQIGADRDQTARTLAGTVANPNVGAAIVVGLGCETVSAEEVAAAAAASGKPVVHLTIQGEGGTLACIRRGAEHARKLAAELSAMDRRPFPLRYLVLGTECGGSDTTSGLAANPALGVASDLVVDAGGTVILSETTEFMGAEHILARRARSPEVGRQILDIVASVEAAINRMGVDLRGAQPTPGNIQGGLTTIEEKSLGCIYKGGTRPINEVLPYAGRPRQAGLVIMDTPGHDIESITGMVAGGAQIIVFTTGRGTPTGCPIAPVIKVSGNTPTLNNMSDNIDLNAGTIIDGTETVAGVGHRIFEEILAVASGKQTKAEILGHREFAIYRVGPTM